MKNNNKIIIAIVAVLIVFSVVYFVSAIKISHAFEFDEELYLYESKVSLIEKAAVEYGNNNKGRFTESDTVYITVEDLLNEKYILPDEEGIINNPKSSKKTLNDCKIRLTLKDDTITSKFLENN